MKKNFIIFISIITFLIGGPLFFQYLKPTNDISKNGVSFSYLKNFKIQAIPSTEGNYINYEIYSLAKSDKRSVITISIPLKDSSTNDHRGAFENNVSSRTDVFIRGHEGEEVTYRVDSSPAGDMPTHGNFIKQYLESKFPNSPVMLEYFQNDTDPTSLNQTWKTIQKTLRY